MEKLKVTEIFESVEGEGIRAGELAIFIRLFGCNLSCKYCDTRYSCDEGSPYTEMRVDEIISCVEKSGYKNITITGGEPLVHNNIEELIRALTAKDYLINIETNGSVDITKIKRAQGMFFTCDYKCPYSGMSDKMFMDNFSNLTESDVLKFVVANKDDLSAALKILNSYKPECYIYFSPVYKKIEPKEIVEFMKEYKLINKVRVQLQLHKYIYPSEMRGV